MTGIQGVGDGRVWVERTSLGRASLQVNEPDGKGGLRVAEAVLTTDEAVDLAAHLLASVRPVNRFDPITGGARTTEVAS